MSVVVVEDSESDGREDAGEIEEKGRRDHFLDRLRAGQAIRVIADVMGQPPTQVIHYVLPELAPSLLRLQAVILYFSLYSNPRNNNKTDDMQGWSSCPCEKGEEGPSNSFIRVMATDVESRETNEFS